MMRFVVFILIVLIPSWVTCMEKADFVLVIKSESTLYLQRIVESLHPVGGPDISTTGGIGCMVSCINLMKITTMKVGCGCHERTKCSFSRV